MNKMILFFFISLSAYGNQYSFKHLDCNIRYNKTDDFLNKMAHQKLKERSFNIKSFVDGDKMNVGDLYFHLEYIRDPKKLWKDCIVNVAVKKATGQRPLSKDRTLYRRSVKRSLPRHTFDGNERCTRALKDAFINIPYCVPMSVEEKVQGN